MRSCKWLQRRTESKVSPHLVTIRTLTGTQPRKSFHRLHLIYADGTRQRSTVCDADNVMAPVSRQTPSLQESVHRPGVLGNERLEKISNSHTQRHVYVQIKKGEPISGLRCVTLKYDLLSCYY